MLGINYSNYNAASINAAHDCALSDAVIDAIKFAARELQVADRPLRVVLGCSGGLDSCVLLHVLWQLGRRMTEPGFPGVETAICHVNHGLRQESAAEAEFVRGLAAEYQLPFYLYSAPARETGQNLEAWARGVRYGFLKACLAEWGGDIILTAHHERDQSETLLLRLLSGRFLTDSHAIQQCSLGRRLLRPILGISHEMIEKYALEHDLQYVEDSSNSDLSRTRNLLRHRLLPMLQQLFNPCVVRELACAASRLSEDETVLWQQARAVLASECSPRRPEFILSLPPAMRWRVLSLLVSESVGSTGGKVGYRALRRLIENLPRLTKMQLGFGITARLTGNMLEFELDDELEPAQFRTIKEQTLTIPGEVLRNYGVGVCGRIKADLRVCSATTYPSIIELAKIQAAGGDLNSAAAYFDADELDLKQIIVRERRDGDSVAAWKRGHRKLKKLFQERGVRLTLRGTIPIVECAGTILWVPGVVRSKQAPICSSTRNILTLVYLREHIF